MYWHDQNPRKRSGAPWRALALLALLAFSLLVAGEVIGWERILLPRSAQEGSATVPLEAADDKVVVTPSTGMPNAGSVGVSAPTSLPAQTAQPIQSATVGQPAPDFSLPDLLEPSRRLALSDYAGRPVILNFWASWCVPCRTEMPALEQASQQFSTDGLQVLGINQTYIDDPEAAIAFVEELSLTFPNAWDETGAVSEGMYRILGLPTSVFISPEGKVAHVHIGPLSEAQIDTFVRNLLTGEEISP